MLETEVHKAGRKLCLQGNYMRVERDKLEYENQMTTISNIYWALNNAPGTVLKAFDELISSCPAWEVGGVIFTHFVDGKLR